MNKTLLCLIAFSAYAQEPDVVTISETIGHMIGKQLDQFGVDFDIDAIAKGMKEESEGKNAPLNPQECVEAIIYLQDEKILLINTQTLHQADAISNGELIDENYSLPASDSPKHR